jgi:hypothetical protein
MKPIFEIIRRKALMFVLQQKASRVELLLIIQSVITPKKMAGPIFRDVWTLFTQKSHFGCKNLRY